MPRWPDPRDGSELQIQPRGFPVFTKRVRKKRIITGNVWACLSHLNSSRLSAKSCKIADAFVAQAFDFFTAADNPRNGSRPLLYYYAFLNLAKVLLLHRNVKLPAKLTHGISDPKANAARAVSFSNQKVEVSGRAANHQEIYPELVHQLAPGGFVAQHGAYSVASLLEQVPSIHRTYCLSTGSTHGFVRALSLELYSDKKNVWARVEFDRTDKSTKAALKNLSGLPSFTSRFHRVASANKKRECWETSAKPYKGRELETAIAELASECRETRMAPMLTTAGWEGYFFGFERPRLLPQACVLYAIMFYLGSVTRYQPYNFSVFTRDYVWLVDEFLSTAPKQFIYTLTSHIAETEVVVPHAEQV